MSAGKEASYKRDQVIGIINSVIGKVSGAPSNEAVYKELLGLKDVMEELRRDLHAVQTTDITKTHIPSASDELDAIVGTTEQATNSIMEACEKIQAAAATAPPSFLKLVETQTTAIFEACTFQDITGQRISKIVKALKEIDKKTHDLVKVIEKSFDAAGPQVAKPAAPAKPVEQSLMNGPQLEGQGISQDEIDRLLKEFDS